MLIDRGADIHAKNEYGDEPLHLAAEFDNDRIAQTLIDNGADVYSRDKHGDTALHLASDGAQWSNFNEFIDAAFSKGNAFIYQI